MNRQVCLSRGRAERIGIMDRRAFAVGSVLRSRIRSVAVAAALVALVATPTPATGLDGVDLRVTRGTVPEHLTLDWSGGQPVFSVYGSTNPAAVVSPENLLGSSSLRTFSAAEGSAPRLFFLVTSPCVVNPPEVCNGVDDDCNGTVDDPGTEVSCSLANATPACLSGSCAISSCDEGWADCDGVAGTGCEYDAAAFPSDPLNCGFCNNSCPDPPNASSECAGGACGFVCDDGFADCNGASGDGCEADLGSDPSRCAQSAWLTTRHDNRRTSRSPIIASQSNGTLYPKKNAGGTGTPSAATSGPTGVVYYTVSGSLKAVDPVDGTIVWSALTDGTTTLTAPVVGSDGTIYVAQRVTAYLEPGIIIALNPDGTPRWSYPTENNAWSFADLAVDETGRVYGRYDGFGGSSSYRFALDAEGNRLWERSAPLPIADSELPAPAIGDDGSLFLVGYNDAGARRLMRIDPANGDVLWAASLSTELISGPVVADNGLVLVHRPGVDPLGGVLAFDPDTGAQVWFVQYQNVEYGSDNPPVLLNNGEIVAIASGPVAGERVIYRISPQGDLLGTTPYPSSGYYVKSVVGGDDRMYVWSSQKLMAFSPLDGSVAFEYEGAMTAGCVYSSQPSVLADGSIFLIWRQKQSCNITTGFNYFVTLAPPAGSTAGVAAPTGGLPGSVSTPPHGPAVASRRSDGAVKEQGP